MPWVTFPYHTTPIAWVPSLEDRRQTILAEKPPREHAVRLHCMVEVDEARLPPEVAHLWSGTSLYWEPYKRTLRRYRQELLALALTLVPDAPWDAAQGALTLPVDPPDPELGEV